MSAVAAKPATLGELIQCYRQKKDISLSKLQELIGIDKSSLSRIENGEVKRPDFNIIQSIAAELDIPSDDIVELYIEIGHKSDVVFSFLQKALEAPSNASLVAKIAAKFLESSNEDSLDLVEKLYQTTDSVEDTSIQLSLFNLIIDYSRNHGIMPYIAKGLYRKYMIERNDFSKLSETYQSGKYILDYANFLSKKERITFYYSLGVHAFSLLKHYESIKFSEYVIENDIPEGEYRANAIFNACNSHYYLDEYATSKTYLTEYSKFPFLYVEDNVKLMNGCLSGKTGDVELGIDQLEEYLNNPSEYNLIYAVTMLMDLYLIKRNYYSAKLLLKYEAEMEISLQNNCTTPDKRSKLALFYKLKGDLLLDENIEEAFDCYMKSALEYMKISLHGKAFEMLYLMTNAMDGSPHLNQKAIRKLSTAFNFLSQ